MKTWFVVASLTLLFVSTGQGASTQLKNFRITQCFEAVCLHATGSKAFVSHSGSGLSGTDIELQWGPSHSVLKVQNCASFRYDIISQLLVCDNREVSGETFTLDRTMQIKHF